MLDKLILIETLLLLYSFLVLRVFRKTFHIRGTTSEEVWISIFAKKWLKYFHIQLFQFRNSFRFLKSFQNKIENLLWACGFSFFLFSRPQLFLKWTHNKMEKSKLANNSEKFQCFRNVYWYFWKSPSSYYNL